MLIRILALALLSSCAAEKHHLGPARAAGLVECAAVICPTEDDLLEAERIFRAVYVGADLPDPIVTPRVKWHAGAPFVDTYGRTVNGAWGRYWIEAASWSGWVHERIHLHHLVIGKPTAHPGGLWLDLEDTSRELELKALLRLMVIGGTS
jgi:hypothetical protein